MAISNTRTKKSNNSFLYIAIIVIGIIGGYIYYSNIIKPAKEPLTPPDIPKDDSLSKFKDLKSFNFSVFSNGVFRSLKILGEVPVQPGVTGRDDIFAPF